MMHGRFGGMLNQETLKPRYLGETLVRLGGYFRRFWYMILLAVGFVVVATWTQVTTPELMGQATDCFLVPTGASVFGADSGSQTNTQASGCWVTTDDPSSLTFTRRLIHNAFHAGGYEFPANATNNDRITGLFRLIIILVILYVAGAILTGAHLIQRATEQPGESMRDELPGQRRARWACRCDWLAHSSPRTDI